MLEIRYKYRKKTEIVIFSKATYRGNFNFKLSRGNKYLGVFFNYNDSFVRHKTHLVGQSRKAMFVLFKKSKELDLPIDMKLELFDSLNSVMAVKFGDMKTF